MWLQVATFCSFLQLSSTPPYYSPLFFAPSSLTGRLGGFAVLAVVDLGEPDVALLASNTLPLGLCRTTSFSSSGLPFLYS